MHLSCKCLHAFYERNMGIVREIPPTAGIPLYLRDFLSAFKLMLSAKPYLEDDFKRYLNVQYARITCSGTVAFYLILESLKKVSNKKTVIIPSYICPLIPLAIEKAGLRVEVCDINRDDFNFNLLQLEDTCSANHDLLALVLVHLAGLSADFDPVAAIAKKHSIFIIEDCAQSLGVGYKRSKAGTLGDFSFFSLCRGKGVTIYEGGVIVTNKKEYETVIDGVIQQFVKTSVLSECSLLAKLFGYWIFYRPLLFWFAFRLPQIYWNWKKDKIKAAMEDFTINFPIHKVSTIRKLIGHAAFCRLENEIMKQRQKATFYRERLKNVAGIKIIEPSDPDATYPYVTVLFHDRERRDSALKVLEKSGLGGSIVYAAAIADYGYLKGIVADRNCSNARHVAERTITLSTSIFLENGDLDFVVKMLETA